MATIADLVVKLSSNTDGLSRGMDKARREMAKTETAAQKMATKMKSIGDTMTLGLTVPLVAFGTLAVKAAMDEDKAMAQLAVALRNNAGASQQVIDKTEEWITKTQNATGIMDDELRPALAILVRSTKDVAEAQNIMTVAMDIAAATGKPLEQVAMALAKAHNGNMAGLGKLGIAYKDAAGNAKTFDQVLIDLNKTYGGSAAAFANTTTGQMNRLKGQLADLTENIGRVLIPILQRVIPLVSKFADAFERMPSWVQSAAVYVGIFVAALGPMLSITARLIENWRVVKSVLMATQWMKSFISGWQDARAAASAFSGVAGTLGGKMRALVEAATQWITKIPEMIAGNIALAATYTAIGVAAAASTVAVYEAVKAAQQMWDAENDLLAQKDANLAADQAYERKVAQKYGRGSDKYKEAMKKAGLEGGPGSFDNGYSHPWYWGPFWWLYDQMRGFGPTKGGGGRSKDPTFIPGMPGIPGFASGGVARAPRNGGLALLHGVERITPVGRGSDMPPLTINIGTVNGTDRRAAEQLATMVGDVLARRARYAHV